MPANPNLFLGSRAASVYSHCIPGLFPAPGEASTSMTELKIFRRCFGYSAIIFACVFATTLPVLLRAPLPFPASRFHAEPVSIFLIATWQLLLVSPVVVAVINAIAWWTITKNRPSARRCAIAACTSLLIMSLPFFATDYVIVPGSVGFFAVLAFALVLSSVGITGIAVFVKYDAVSARNHLVAIQHHSIAPARS